MADGSEARLIRTFFPEPSADMDQPRSTSIKIQVVSAIALKILANRAAKFFPPPR